jgi:hypothetical protein
MQLTMLYYLNNYIDDNAFKHLELINNIYQQNIFAALRFVFVYKCV